MKRSIAMAIMAIGGAWFCMDGRDITGSVVADKDSTEIVGAICRLLSDGNYLSSTSTDGEGRFLLKTESRLSFKANDELNRIKMEILHTG